MSKTCREYKSILKKTELILLYRQYRLTGEYEQNTTLEKLLCKNHLGVSLE